MIAFLSVFPPFRGGIARFSHHLYEELRQRHTTHAYNFTKLYPPLLFPGTSQTEQGEEPYAVPVLHSHQPLNWRAAGLRMLQAKPQVLVYSHWHPFFAPAMRAAISTMKDRRPGLEVVGLFHNVLPHEYFPGARLLTNRLLEVTDVPVVLSSQTEAEMAVWRPGRDPVRLFHPVYDQPVPAVPTADLRRKHGIRPDETVLLFFGFVRPYKGLDILIEALNRLDLAALNLRILVVGEFYIDPAETLKGIRNEHLPQYEIVNRYVSREEAGEYLALSDALVLPYRSASQSGILSNAVNFQLPVIVSNLPGLTDHVSDGVNGYIHRREDPADLARAIHRFVTEADRPSLRAAMGALKAELGWGTFARRLLGTVGME